MPISTQHPEYLRQVPKWTKSRDTIEGEERVCEKITTYLPVPPGLNEGATTALVSGSRVIHTRYSFYASFAEFPEIVGPTIEAFQGIIHDNNAPKIELPPELRYLIQNATVDGSTLLQLWKTVTRELLSGGRISLLGEIHEETDQVVLCPYVAETLINWREEVKRNGGDVELIVFREFRSEPTPEDEYILKDKVYYRELRLEDGKYVVRVWKAEDTLADATVVQDDDTDALGFVSPMLLGGAFDFIPITVLNANGLGLEYGPIPALPLAKIALSIFRKSATYHRALYVKGDPQAVIAADMDEEDLPTTVGGGELWLIPAGGQAKYLDIDGQGIPMNRQSIQDLFERFMREGGRLMEQVDKINPSESGVAVEKRLNAQQVTLVSLVIEAGLGMQTALRMLGKMRGMSEEAVEKIIFEPNLKFAASPIDGDELVKIITAKNQGLVLSHKSIHERIAAAGVTNKTYEEEVAEIEKEEPPLGMLGREPEPEPEPEPDEPDEP